MYKPVLAIQRNFISPVIALFKYPQRMQSRIVDKVRFALGVEGDRLFIKISKNTENTKRRMTSGGTQVKKESKKSIVFW